MPKSSFGFDGISTKLIKTIKVTLMFLKSKQASPSLLVVLVIF